MCMYILLHLEFQRLFKKVYTYFQKSPLIILYLVASKDKGSLPATCWVLSGTFYQAFYQAVYCKNTYLGKKTITFLQKLLTTKMIMLTRASRACNSIYTDSHL